MRVEAASLALSRGRGGGLRLTPQRSARRRCEARPERPLPQRSNGWTKMSTRRRRLTPADTPTLSRPPRRLPFLI
ncbi:unnamed protein product [Urochloa humidicola]